MSEAQTDIISFLSATNSPAALERAIESDRARAGRTKAPARVDPSAQPAAETESSVGSKQIVYMSIALISLLLFVLFNYPAVTLDLMAEFKLILAMLMSCFALGISGWFQPARKMTRWASLQTLVVLVVLTSIWYVWFGGQWLGYLQTAKELIAAVLPAGIFGLKS